MPALDFAEIAVAYAGVGRDDFELFARDFLVTQGFEILVGPDRGPDAGRDLVVRELREGPGGQTELRWLVSCKHKAASGNAVGHTDEQNMRDRLETHGCKGFIAFYSTVPSSTLATHLKSLTPAYGLLRQGAHCSVHAPLSSKMDHLIAVCNCTECASALAFT